MLSLNGMSYTIVITAFPFLNTVNADSVAIHFLFTVHNHALLNCILLNKGFKSLNEIHTLVKKKETTFVNIQ